MASSEYLLKLLKYEQVAFLEDLNIKGMIKNKKLAKSISDASWSSFIRMLKYKASWKGKTVLQVDRFYASSKICNHCKTKKSLLTLNERVWVCSECGGLHDRDINAALNLREEGLKLLNL